MLKETGKIELAINYNTVVTDLEKMLNKKKIYSFKHPTIKLLADDPALSDKGIMLLFLALTFMELDGKLKPLLKKKNGKHKNGKIKMNTEQRIESVIENKYNIDVEVDAEKDDRALKKEKYAHLPIRWGTGTPKISDFAGFFGKEKLNLKEIRDKAWGRK